MPSDAFNKAAGIAGGAGLLGAGLGGLFGDYNNPADAAMPYMNQIPDALKKYLEPYINAGTSQIPGLENAYGGLINDPGGVMNKIGQGYHQSPGFQFALQQALQGAGHAAAAGGMAGSPQAMQQNMQTATGLANQDYNNWLGNALGMYRTGLQGSQNLFNTGAQTSMGMGEDLASVLANQAKLAYEGQNAQNQSEGGIFGAITGGAASMLPYFFM